MAVLHFRELAQSITSFHTDYYASRATPHPQRDETWCNYMAAAEKSMILRVGSNTPARRFPFLIDFPAAAKALLLGFHRAHLSLHGLKANKNQRCSDQSCPTSDR
jgi:hypothetical protein